MRSNNAVAILTHSRASGRKFGAMVVECAKDRRVCSKCALKATNCW